MPDEAPGIKAVFPVYVLIMVVPLLLFLYSAAFRIGTCDPRVKRMPLPGVESMKPKGYMLRHLGPGQLRVRGCVQYEQKRSVLASIEHDREDDAFVFISCAWRCHKHWLSRITPVLVPGTRGLCAYIDFDQL